MKKSTFHPFATPKPSHLIYIFSLLLSTALFLPAPAHAIVNGSVGDEDPTATSEVFSPSESSSAPASDSATAEPPETPTNSEDSQSTFNEDPTPGELGLGLADEPEVVCATGKEPGCNGFIDPELLPLYISLGALAVTILLIVIINLISRHRHKNRE